MHPYCIYVFDSSTANEAAIAVKEGQYESIIQYHSNKHQQMGNKQIQLHHQPQQPSPMQGQAQPPPPTHHMMGGPPSYPIPPPPQHVSPPNHMQQHPMGPGAQPPQQSAMQSAQPYDPNLSPQKMKERESKLNRLGQLAQLTTQPPPPTMHQMTPINSGPQRGAPVPPPSTRQQQPPPPPQQQQQQQAQQAPQQQPPQQQQQQQQTQIQQGIKQVTQQHMDPLSSMAAMSECPNMDSYGHTIHHHPPPHPPSN